MTATPAHDGDHASSRDVVRPSRRAPGPRRAIRDGIGWALAGFIIGAVFWHFVGFWTFVSTVVLKGADEPHHIHAVEYIFRRSAGPVANCTTLVLDRTSGGTRAEPCAGARALEARDTGRGDLASLEPSRGGLDGDALSRVSELLRP